MMSSERIAARKFRRNSPKGTVRSYRRLQSSPPWSARSYCSMISRASRGRGLEIPTINLESSPYSVGLACQRACTKVRWSNGRQERAAVQVDRENIDEPPVERTSCQNLLQLEDGRVEVLATMTLWTAARRRSAGASPLLLPCLPMSPMAWS